MPTPLVVIACVVNGGAGDFANTVAQEFDRVCVCVMEKDVQSMHGTLQWNVSGTVVRACVGNVEAHMLQRLH